jgi:hypothetical protein
MSSATSMYALGLDQLTNIIVNTGATNFFLVEGRMGLREVSVVRYGSQSVTDTYTYLLRRDY